MKYILSVFCFVFGLNVFAQPSQYINIPWQGYVNTGATEVRASFYLAGEDFDLTTAFNDRNYPYWYSENKTLQVDGGVIHTILSQIPADSLKELSGFTWLYVTINGQPFEKVRLYSVPWSVWSDHATHSETSEKSDISIRSTWADTANYARRSGVADSATRAGHSSTAGHSLTTDRADSAFHSVHSDSSVNSRFSVRASLADNAQFAIFADSANKADSSWWAFFADRCGLASNSLRSQIAELAIMADSVRDGKVTSSTIIDNSIQRVDLANGIIDNSAMAPNSVNSANIQNGTVAFEDMNIAGTPTNNSVVGYNNGNLQWISNNNILTGAVQQTTLIPTQINQDARWVILQVAQDFNLVGITPTQGRVITIVNASTANTVTLTNPNWNIFGGAVNISPRTSKTLVYLNGDWIILQ